MNSSSNKLEEPEVIPEVKFDERGLNMGPENMTALVHITSQPNAVIMF